jgi:hypothetical protein
MRPLRRNPNRSRKNQNRDSPSHHSVKCPLTHPSACLVYVEPHTENNILGARRDLTTSTRILMHNSLKKIRFA